MLSALKSEISSVVDYILGVPDSIWRLFDQVSGIGWLRLRSDVILGSQASAAALLKNFAVAEQPPWSLCCASDIEAVVDELSAGIEPDEQVTWSMWQLGQVGYDRAELYAGVRLLRSLPWSHVITDQGHASSALTMKKHRLYGTAMLQSRSMLRQMACRFRPCP